MSETEPLLPGKKESLLDQQVSSHGSIPPLALLCLVTGLVNISAWQTTRVWVGFLTGQTLQIGAAIPRIAQTGHVTMSDRLQVTALLGVGAGAHMGGIIKRHYGSASRRALWIRSLSETGFLLVAALLLISSPHGSLDWEDPIGFICQALLSLEQGMQGMDGLSLNTELATTVVQTSVWLGYFSLPAKTLFSPGRQKARDTRLLGISMLLVGGAMGSLFFRSLHSLRRAQGFTVLVAAFIRFTAALLWLFVTPKADQ